MYKKLAKVTENALWEKFVCNTKRTEDGTIVSERRENTMDVGDGPVDPGGPPSPIKMETSLSPSSSSVELIGYGHRTREQQLRKFLEEYNPYNDPTAVSGHELLLRIKKLGTPKQRMYTDIQKLIALLTFQSEHWPLCRLDEILEQYGMLRRSQITEIVGESASGKTTVCVFFSVISFE